MNATDAKNRFGELLDSARSNPVTIEKNGRAVAVLVSADRFELYQALGNIPAEQVNSRMSELILKGLAFERQMKVEQDYQEFNRALAEQASSKKGEEASFIKKMMSAKAFEPEDETEDFF
jgi:prevent-host-death family protein